MADKHKKISIASEIILVILIFICSLFLFNRVIDSVSTSVSDNDAEVNTVIYDSLTKGEKKFSSYFETIVENELSKDKGLEIHYISCGQGDATLLICDGKTMVIDAGPDSFGTGMQNYLLRNGITTIDYVVLTHYDFDHAGGMDVVLQKFDCRTIFMPEYEVNTKSYYNVKLTMEAKGYNGIRAVPGMEFMLGSAKVTILAPSNYNDDDENNYSTCLMVQHGKNRFLFTGDAEVEEENELLMCGYDIRADVYQVGHHGSYTSSSVEFLDEVSPKYVVISCGMDNVNGHPHASTLNKFKARGFKVFRTDEQGSIIARSDGRAIMWNNTPSKTWKTGTVKK